MDQNKATSPHKPQGEIYQRDFDPRNDPRTFGADGHDLLEHYNSVEGGTSRATNWALSYGVRKSTPAADESGVKYAPVFEAFTPYRQVTYTGTTREEAIASLLFGVADLARNGAFNPHDAMAKGSPPMQHAMEVLETRLQWHLKQRKEYLELHALNHGEPDVSTETGMFLGPVGRHNEAIISLGTAIAALARVKDL